MEEFVTKTAETELSELDEKGYVEAYANVYSIKDLAGDTSHPSSFVKTVSERYKEIKVYKNHDDNVLVGVPKLLDATDPYGLKTGTQFQMKTDAGRDTFQDVKFLHNEGFNAGVSIGAWVVKRDPKNKSIVTEYRLKEYSFLTKQAANSLSLVLSTKSKDDADATKEVIEYLTKMYNLPYSDKRLTELENILKSLTSEPEPIATTRKGEPMNTQIFHDLI